MYEMLVTYGASVAFAILLIALQYFTNFHVYFLSISLIVITFFITFMFAKRVFMRVIISISRGRFHPFKLFIYIYICFSFAYYLTHSVRVIYFNIRKSKVSKRRKRRYTRVYIARRITGNLTCENTELFVRAFEENLFHPRVWLILTSNSGW